MARSDRRIDRVNQVLAAKYAVQQGKLSQIVERETFLRREISELRRRSQSAQEHASQAMMLLGPMLSGKHGSNARPWN